jgi:predicted Zn finger-like uncharacterized protein
MFTVCPKCALTLVVTAADLRVAQGYVRCGRCSSVFNALAQLSDERSGAAAGAEPPPPVPEPEEPASAPSNPRARAGSQAPRPAEADIELIPEDALEFNPDTTDAASVFVAPPPNPDWTAATGSFKALVAGNQETGAPERRPQAADEVVDVELDAALLSDIVQSDSPRQAPVSPAPAPPSSTRAAAAPIQAPAASPAAPATAHRRPGHARPGEGAAAKPAHSAHAPASRTQSPPDDVPMEEAVALAGRPGASVARGALVWTIAAALLAVVLAAQVINHRRDTLATDPRFNRPLTAIYAALGVPLVPRWDLHSYDVRQLGATVDPGTLGAITVRASIRNSGPNAQPLPLLRVTLQDRFGNRLASRDVLPRDYLPASVAPSALLAADQRIDAELAFVDPGASAVGFELDACLPVRGGGIACANDVVAP